MPDGYPIHVDVEYPDRPLNRLTTGLRIFTIIPIAIVLGTVSGETSSWYAGNGAAGTTRVVVVSAGGLLFAGPLLMILFRQKYPRWWFDWNLELTRFSSRVALYAALFDDRYPSTDEQQSRRLDIPNPDARVTLDPVFGDKPGIISGTARRYRNSADFREIDTQIRKTNTRRAASRFGRARRSSTWWRAWSSSP